MKVMEHDRKSDFARWREKRSGQHSHADVLAFFRAICEDEMEIPEELEQIILFVVQKQMDEKLREQGYHHEDSDGDADYKRHRRFKEVVEELRELPSQAVDGRILERFGNLNDAEHKVLKVLSQERSKAKMAECASMTLPRFMEIKHALEKKVK